MTPQWRRDTPAQSVRQPPFARAAPAARPLPPAGPRVRPRTEFEAASAHSNRVRSLRIGLPVAAAGIAAAILASLVYSSNRRPSIDIAAIRIENGRLAMDSPELAGVDANKRPYRLKAARALQDAANPARVALDAIEATLPFNDQGNARIVAGNGLYDATAKTLALGGNIEVDTEDGIRLRLVDANIDIDKGAMNTAKPVEVDTGTALVTADTLRVEDKGKTIVFENRVRMTLRAAGGGAEDGR
jgi:lipopolysaccharide export system protein LptC